MENGELALSIVATHSGTISARDLMRISRQIRHTSSLYLTKAKVERAVKMLKHACRVVNSQYLNFDSYKQHMLDLAGGPPTREALDMIKYCKNYLINNEWCRVCRMETFNCVCNNVAINLESMTVVFNTECIFCATSALECQCNPNKLTRARTIALEITQDDDRSESHDESYDGSHDSDE